MACNNVSACVHCSIIFCFSEEPATIILSTNTSVSIISVKDRSILGTLPIVARAMDYNSHTLYWIGLNDGVSLVVWASIFSFIVYCIN